MLTAYFVLVIRFGVKDEVLVNYEFLFHLVPIGFGLATATTAAAKGWFDNATVWCWLAGFDQENAVQWSFYFAPLFFCMLFVSINMFAIYRGVYMKEKESLKFQFESHKQLVSPYMMYQANQNNFADNPDITTSSERSAAIRNGSPSYRIHFSSDNLSDGRPSPVDNDLEGTTNNNNIQQQDLEVATNTTTMTNTTTTPFEPLLPDPATPLPPVGESPGLELSSSEMIPEPVSDDGASGEDVASANLVLMDEQARKQTKFMQSMARLNSLRRSAAKSKRKLKRTRQVAVQATLYGKYMWQ